MISLSYGQKEEIGFKYVRDMLDPVSPYGVKYLKAEGFYGRDSYKELEDELHNIDLLRRELEENAAIAADLRDALSELKDLSGTFAAGMTQDLTEVELFELFSYCRRMKELKRLAEALPSYSRLAGIILKPVDEALLILDPAENGHLGFYIEDCRTPELTAARQMKRELELQLRTASGAEREELLKDRQEAVRLEEEALQKIYADMSAGLRPYLPVLAENAAAAGRLDAGLAKAALARKYGCAMPLSILRLLMLWQSGEEALLR